MKDPLYFSVQRVSPFIKKAVVLPLYCHFSLFEASWGFILLIYGLRIVIDTEFMEAEDNFTPIGRKYVWQVKLF